LTMLPKKWRGGEPQFAPLGAFRPAFLREEEGGKYLDGSQGDRGYYGDEQGFAGHLPGVCCGVFDLLLLEELRERLGVVFGEFHPHGIGLHVGSPQARQLFRLFR
jgi:hypothetical protein